jgi:glycosyltransferase involved in cell wall biosynthesis
VYNAEAYIKNALISVLNQDYDNYDVYITDDRSSDNTVDVIQDFVYEYSLEDTFLLNLNETRQYALHNLHDMVQVECEDDDVFITLDGDDWLSGDDVLSKLDQIYTEEDCWLTYGSYAVYPGGGDSSFHVSEYPQDVIESGDFKKDPQWRASHLRTFKAKLAKRLTKEDLLDEDGGYYHYAYDQALMFPMMEMARERIRFIPDILCVYNDENPMNVHKVEPQSQIDMAERIRNNHEKKDRVG